LPVQPVSAVLPRSFYEDTTVNDAPAEDQLGEITSGNIIPLFEKGDRMNPRLPLNAEFKLFYDVFAEFSIDNQFSHPLPVMFTGQKFEREISLGKGQD
jgi:hypothetical protein